MPGWSLTLAVTLDSQSHTGGRKVTSANLSRGCRRVQTFETGEPEDPCSLRSSPLLNIISRYRVPDRNPEVASSLEFRSLLT